MSEDEKETLRKAAIKLIEPDYSNLPYIIIKTLDVSHKVRNTVYKILKSKEIPFDTLKWEDRISLVINGLKDTEAKV